MICLASTLAGFLSGWRFCHLLEGVCVFKRLWGHHFSGRVLNLKLQLEECDLSGQISLHMVFRLYLMWFVLVDEWTRNNCSVYQKTDSFRLGWTRHLGEGDPVL